MCAYVNKDLFGNFHPCYFIFVVIGFKMLSKNPVNVVDLMGEHEVREIHDHVHILLC